MKILAGDIGGTKTLLQIVAVEKNNLSIVHAARFESSAWPNFIALLEEFLRPISFAPEKACLAVAGPVDGNCAKLTNLAWEDLDATRLAAHLGIHQIALINDFQAVGYGIEGLTERELATLQTGKERLHAPRALIGAGTGLGQSILVWQNGRYLPLDTEGGHVDFAPLDREQEQLLNFLTPRYAHVSYERLLSGAGLEEIYRFLYNSTTIKRELIPNDSLSLDAAAISAAALAARDPIAIRSMRLFIRIYGQQAGNLALTCLARGGVYVAGGIAPQILSFFQDGEFIRAFCAKGRMERLLAEMPVRVVLNSQVGLLGATLVAARA